MAMCSELGPEGGDYLLDYVLEAAKTVHFSLFNNLSDISDTYLLVCSTLDPLLNQATVQRLL